MSVMLLSITELVPLGLFFAVQPLIQASVSLYDNLISNLTDCR